jgi:capsular exopolysaccharide synthesis family protein
VDFASYKQSQAALVKQRVTLSSALKPPAVSGLEVVRKAEPDALTWLDHNLKVDARPGSEFMRVTIEGDNGEELRTLLDAVGKAYLAAVDERDNGARRRRMTRLEDTHRTYRTELDAYQKRVETIAKVLGSKDGPTLAVMDTVLQDDLRQAAREHASAREQVQLAELEVPAAPRPGAVVALPPLPEGLIDEELRRDAGLQRLEADVAQAKQVLTDTEALFEQGKAAPQLTKAKEAVKAAEEKRDRYRTDRRPQIEAAVREAVKKADEDRQGDARRAVDRLKNRAELAKERVAEVERKIAKMSEYRLELEGIKRNAEQTEKLASRLADEIKQVEVEVGAPPRVTLAEEPYVVPGIEGNRRLKYTLIVAGVVLALGFAGVVGWEYRSRRVVHAGEVTSEIGLTLLGTLPPAGAAAGSSNLALVEAIDTTRTMLLHAGGMRSVLVTSAVAGEGKTSLAGHLAISLARGGFRTLLVDGDFHSPKAHRLFALPEGGPGLSEALRGEVSLESAVHPSPLPGLAVLPAGRWDMAARQALVGDRWRQAKAELEARYDYVVIDTAPLLLVSDTLLLAREADGVVLSVLHGVSQVAHVAEMAGRLQAVGAKLKGAVVSGVWDHAHRAHYRNGGPGDDRAADPRTAA